MPLRSGSRESPERSPLTCNDPSEFSGDRVPTVLLPRERYPRVGLPTQSFQGLRPPRPIVLTRAGPF
jgi:hypothetical protein